MTLESLSFFSSSFGTSSSFFFFLCKFCSVSVRDAFAYTAFLGMTSEVGFSFLTITEGSFLVALLLLGVSLILPDLSEGFSLLSALISFSMTVFFTRVFPRLSRLVLSWALTYSDFASFITTSGVSFFFWIGSFSLSDLLTKDSFGSSFSLSFSFSLRT